MQLNQDLDLSLPLPDIVLSTGFVPESGPSGSRAPVPPPRRFAPATERPQPPPRRPRRRRPVDKRKREDTPEDTRPDQRQRENWLQVGKELRKIADGFRASNSSLQEDGGNRSSTDIEAMKKEQSLLSLLVPAPFRGSLWTAVIFLVGWRILAGRVW
ncbi:hypothetical protein C0J52_25320 [Blattella germanica]|nr:hypothetical protein C0J52_25320 [Blattella germanica]